METPELGARGGGGPAGVREAAWGCASRPRGMAGARSPETASRPRMEGLSPSIRATRPLCPALSHTAEPGLKRPGTSPTSEAGLLGGRQRGRKRGFSHLGRTESRGAQACCPGFAAHRSGLGAPCPTCGMEEPRPGTGSGGAPQPGAAEPISGAAIMSTPAGPPAGSRSAGWS